MGDGFAGLHGLPRRDQYSGWVLGAAFFALSGLPPSGLFVSEFIIIRQIILYDPWLCLPFSLGLVLCAIPVLRRTGALLFAPARLEKPEKAGWVIHLVSLHLGLLFVLALAMPVGLVHLLSASAMVWQ